MDELDTLFEDSAADDHRAAANRASKQPIFHAGETRDFTPFKDLWNAAAADLGITTKRMRNDALAQAAADEAVWRDTSASLTAELERQRETAGSPEQLEHLRGLETQLDVVGRMQQSSNPQLREAGLSMLGQVTESMRAFDVRQEEQRIAREASQAAIEREVGAEAWSRMQGIADDLRTESAPFLGQKEAWGRIKASMADPSEAGDYALLYSVHKMLDPGSTVLASEFQNSQNLAGVPDIIVTARNRLRDGERLTPEQRAAFVKMGELQYKQSSEQQSERNERYLERARAGGVPEKYFGSLTIPVFSPGEMPTNFGESKPLVPEEGAHDVTPLNVVRDTAAGIGDMYEGAREGIANTLTSLFGPDEVDPAVFRPKRRTGGQFGAERAPELALRRRRPVND